MLEFLGSLVGPMISGIVSAVSAVLLMMNRYQDKLEKLSGAVEHLKTERVNKLEITFEEHLSQDQTQGLSVTLNNISQSIVKVSAEVQQIGKDVAVLNGNQGIIQRLIDSETIQNKEIATLAADRRGDRSFIENINTALQHHKQGGHHVG